MLFLYLVRIFGKYVYGTLEKNKYLMLFVFGQIMMYSHYLLTLKFSYFTDSVRRLIIEVSIYSKYLYFNEILLFFTIGFILIFIIIPFLKSIISFRKQAVWKEVLVSVSGNMLVFINLTIILGYLKYIVQFENII